MKATSKQKQEHAARRAHRSRARIRGTSVQPRLSVKRSARHIYVQLIDDSVGKTLVSASDHDVQKSGKPTNVAKDVGKKVAEKAINIGVKKVTFDRGAYRYHGRVAALADGAREGGLIF